MKINDILFERVVNAIDEESKSKYVDEVWKILQDSYAAIGGFQSASSPEELINDSGIWKIVQRDGEITAVVVYKDKHGRKAIASGTNGTARGKKDYFMITGDDIRLGRSWAEVSGAPAKIMKRLGADPIPSEYAGMLTGKEILDINPDGYHYTRLIAGYPHEKIIYGVVSLEPSAANLLKNKGIDLKSLPKNIKINS